MKESKISKKMNNVNRDKVKTSEEKKRIIVFLVLGIIFALIEVGIIAILSNTTKIGKNILFIIAFLYIYFHITKIALKFVQFILTLLKIIKYQPENSNYIYDKVKKNLQTELNVKYQKEMDVYKARIVCNGVLGIIVFIFCLLGKNGIVLAIVFTFFVSILPIICLLGKDPEEYFVGQQVSQKSNNYNIDKEKKEHIKFKRAYFKDAFGNIKGTANTISFSDELGGFETTEFKDNSGNTTGKIKKY